MKPNLFSVIEECLCDNAYMVVWLKRCRSMTDVLYPSAPPIGITVTSWAELRLSVYNASLSGWGGTHAQVMGGGSQWLAHTSLHTYTCWNSSLYRGWLQLFTPLLANHHVLIRKDNKTAAAYINHRRGGSTLSSAYPDTGTWQTERSTLLCAGLLPCLTSPLPLSEQQVFLLAHWGIVCHYALTHRPKTGLVITFTWSGWVCVCWYPVGHETHLASPLSHYRLEGNLFELDCWLQNTRRGKSAQDGMRPLAIAKQSPE